ncbi:hypothetical protein [Dyadobacter sp.]|uniref:hypothetical protein n=1 Tax=Dyadobacter sp. TaxID=1914288 RepID=UPI003F710807
MASMTEQTRKHNVIKRAGLPKQTKHNIITAFFEEKVADAKKFLEKNPIPEHLLKGTQSHNT